MPDDAIVGYGEHQQLPPGQRLNIRGATFNHIDCIQYNKSFGGEVCIPMFGVVRRGRPVFVFFMNIPSYGYATLASRTDPTAPIRLVFTWGPQIDFLVATSFQALVRGIGLPPPLPQWARGYWHSKNRYHSQAAVEAAAAGFRALGIPISVIVIDYLHWGRLGDWRFDPAAWPDPSGMVRRLTDWGVERVMVSVWPFTESGSASYQSLVDGGLVAGPLPWDDGLCDSTCFLYDPFLPEGRAALFRYLTHGYLRHNISVFWLDASEPEVSTPAALRAAVQDSFARVGGAPGSGWPAQAVAMAFPLFHARGVTDGLRQLGIAPVVLARSAWAGSAAAGAALWSGDTNSTWDTLVRSIPAGLGVQLSGIAWWTTDIGGYMGGDPTDPAYCQLLVRWFQFGVTCPIFRQHGYRDTDPWAIAFPPAYKAVVATIHLRYHPVIAAHIAHVSAEASRSGTPINRPMWWHCPDEPPCRDSVIVERQYWWGDTFLVAPVTAPGATQWEVYLPLLDGAVWRHWFTGQTFHGGVFVNVSTPLDSFPLFQRIRTGP